MEKYLVDEEEYRGCKIQFFEQWSSEHLDKMDYSYEIVDRQGNSRTDETDNYPFGILDSARVKAIDSINNDLDNWCAISCLAVDRDKYEHFALSFHGEKEEAFDAGMKELAGRYPEWKHSVSVSQLNWMNPLKMKSDGSEDNGTR